MLNPAIPGKVGNLIRARHVPGPVGTGLMDRRGLIMRHRQVLNDK